MAGFDERMATALSRQATTEEIQKQINWLKIRNPQRNSLGMLRRAIEEHWSPPATAGAGLSSLHAFHQEPEIELRQVSVRSAAANHKQDRLAERVRLLDAWNRLSASDQASCRKRAIAEAPNEAVRRLLLRNRDLSSPLNDVLDMMVREFSTPQI